MLSANFYSTYQQYKRDTNAVASWLASTAKQHGYDGQIGTRLSRGSRPEGKARKLANQRQRQQQQGPGSTMDSNSKNASDQQSQRTGPAYVLAVRDFVPLGQFIAKKLDNLAKVPSHFTASLTRVIRARRGFMSLYGKANLDNENAKTNQTHAYFITVLETVYYILVPAESRVNLKADVDIAMLTLGMSALKSSEHTLTNPFGLLPIYKPSEGFLNAPDIPASSSTDNNKDKQHLLYTVKEDNSKYKCKFAFVMLLQDLISLRQEVAALWQAYDDGGISLAAAVPSFPIIDEFTRGLSLLIKTMKVPLWLCFAGQNYLDTLHILGPRVDKEYRELKTFSQETVTLVQHAVAKAPSTASKRDLQEIKRIATITSGGSDMFTLI
ncbi:hypothetical protein EsDP_00007105 [Epichloe bromicola]|uniref:DUF6604 domain-containing protein n=1 Tax=Epichloe bromicola TaxID=79588 RepID=A0ABQ0CZK4_9HYPO